MTEAAMAARRREEMPTALFIVDRTVEMGTRRERGESGDVDGGGKEEGFGQWVLWWR